MSLIGDVIGGVGAIFGGINSSKAMKEVRNNLKSQRLANRAWFERRYDEDATQRADAQAANARAEEEFRNRNRDAAGAQAVAGGTEESVAATKAANARALAATNAAIAADAERRKDGLEREYLAKDEALQGELNDIEMQKAGNIAQASMGVEETAKNIEGLF